MSRMGWDPAMEFCRVEGAEFCRVEGVEFCRVTSARKEEDWVEYRDLRPW